MTKIILPTKDERRIKRAERRERQREANLLRARQMHIARVEYENSPSELVWRFSLYGFCLLYPLTFSKSNFPTSNIFFRDIELVGQDLRQAEPKIASPISCNVGAIYSEGMALSPALLALMKPHAMHELVQL